MQNELIFEIGTEEIPARFLQVGVEELKGLAEESLKRERLKFEEVRTFATPRRLVLFVRGLADMQEDVVKEVRGPAKKTAIDSEGHFTRAALGFARSQGVEPAELVVKRIPQGEYLFALLEEKGRATTEVLPGLLQGLVSSLTFPKSMRWGNNDIRFARPIRWLLAVYGSKALEFSIDGIKAGTFTFGHRYLAPGPHRIRSVDEYFQVLRDSYCILDQEERRQMVITAVDQAAAQAGGKALLDEDLLDEVTFLVEYPTALCGRFSGEFLQLPSEVLITTMKKHQRYFPVVDGEDRLLPAFVAIRDGGSDHLDIVRAGNERVLRARLADARFFYEEDKRIPLIERVKELSRIIFQEDLGTMAEKVERIRALAGYIGRSLGVGGETLLKIERAALLCKADLVTNTVREFPELQGQMGREYARLSGEDEIVANAIFESYLPRFSGDLLPSTEVGRIISLADKFDTVVGAFGVGLAPTGSKDPYALRRQTLGILNILIEAGIHLRLRDVIGKAVEIYRDASKIRRDGEETKNEVLDFFRQRLDGLLQEKGLKYDVIDAVLAAGFDDVVETLERAKALNEVRSTPEFLDLIVAITRADRISKGVTPAVIDPSLFREEAEGELYEAYMRCRDEIKGLLETGGPERFSRLLSIVSTLRGPVDRFFEDVLVMADDEALRCNRLSLLRMVADLPLRVADLSKIIPEA